MQVGSSIPNYWAVEIDAGIRQSEPDSDMMDDCPKDNPTPARGNAGEVAEVVVCLLSSNAGCVTGQAIAVYGALQIRRPRFLRSELT
jgi:enoyl-[acyl-carrier-protein] reductase (NADH)